MKVLHLDSPGGLHGNLLLGALIDLGVTPSTIEWELGKLPLGDFHLHFERELRADIEGVHFSIHEGTTHTHEQDEPDAHEHSHDHGDGCGCGHEHHDHAHSEHEHTHEHEDDDEEEGAEIAEVLEDSELSDFVKTHVAGIFRRLGHDDGFEEEDALAAVAQVVGACVGLEQLGVDVIAVAAEQPSTSVTSAIAAEFGEESAAATSPRLIKTGYGIGTGDLILRAELLETTLVPKKN